MKRTGLRGRRGFTLTYPVKTGWNKIDIELK